jgi:hypothetical protein
LVRRCPILALGAEIHVSGPLTNLMERKGPRNYPELARTGYFKAVAAVSLVPASANHRDNIKKHARFCRARGRSSPIDPVAISSMMLHRHRSPWGARSRRPHDEKAAACRSASSTLMAIARRQRRMCLPLPARSRPAPYWNGMLPDVAAVVEATRVGWDDWRADESEQPRSSTQQQAQVGRQP